MSKNNKNLSRRDALKVLGAAAGATVLANLPEKWSKPELVSGVLPAHAQTSACRVFTAEVIATSGNSTPLGWISPLTSATGPGAVGDILYYDNCGTDCIYGFIYSYDGAYPGNSGDPSISATIRITTHSKTLDVVIDSNTGYWDTFYYQRLLTINPVTGEIGLDGQGPTGCAVGAPSDAAPIPGRRD